MGSFQSFKVDFIHNGGMIFLIFDMVLPLDSIDEFH